MTTAFERTSSEKEEPIWGRVSLLGMLGLMLLTYVGVGTNMLPGGLWALSLVVAILGGIVLAVVSLVRGERRAFAVITLSLVLAAPVLFLIGTAVFFSFFYNA